MASFSSSFLHSSFDLISSGDLCNSNLLVPVSLLTLQQLTKLHQLAIQQTPFTPLGQTTPAFPGTYPQDPLDNSFSLHPEKYFFPLHSTLSLFWHSMTRPLWFCLLVFHVPFFVLFLALFDRHWLTERKERKKISKYFLTGHIIFFPDERSSKIAWPHYHMILPQHVKWTVLLKLSYIVNVINKLIMVITNNVGHISQISVLKCQKITHQ